jgi:hypothetical protein
MYFLLAIRQNNILRTGSFVGNEFGTSSNKLLAKWIRVSICLWNLAIRRLRRIGKGLFIICLLQTSLL